jgi:hypothetical protein
VADAINTKDFQKAMSLRDPEFVESLDAFFETSRWDPNARSAKEKVRLVASHTVPLLTKYYQWMRVGIMQYASLG